ncbi:MAG TPA: hypothetical protein VMT63_04655 [Bacteroidales bacterium]|nr:hypothetical protein [Bacteroidales bacterium]
MAYLGASFVMIFLISLGVSLLPLIFYILTLQGTLQEVKPENRRMDPGLVWLTIIPLFGIIWQFIVVGNIADSLKAEFAQRNINAGEDRPGYSIGLTFCILICCSIIPFLGILTAVAGFVCWIIYWVKIADYRSMLRQHKAANPQV